MPARATIVDQELSSSELKLELLICSDFVPFAFM